jgi:diguanylate cyclase (GGDEF)-like protein
MKKKSIVFKIIVLFVCSVFFFGLLPNFINTNYLFRQYNEEFHARNEQVLNSTIKDFRGQVNSIESAVETFEILTKERFSEEGEFLLPDLNQEEIYYEKLFKKYISETDTETESVYIYFDPSFDATDIHDVWIHNNGIEIVRETEYDWYGVHTDNASEWFYEPKELGYSYWVDPYTNRYDEYITSYVTPVYYEENFIGIIGMYLEIEHIEQLVDDNAHYEGDLFWIYNSDGKIIYHPNYESGTYWEDIADIRQYESEQLIIMDNQKYYTYETTLSQGWTVLYSIPSDSIDQIRSQVVSQVIIISLLAILLMSLFILFIMRKYKRLFTEIIFSLNKIQNGDLKHRLVKRTDDEIGVMVDAINLSNESLYNSIEEREKLAYYNTITDLPNRNSLSRDVESYFRKNNNIPMAFVYIDIDQFRMINDILGYNLGNEFIDMISKKLVRFTSDKVKIYHTSIDEFVLVMKGDYSIDSLQYLSEELLNEFGKNVNFASRRFFVTVCIGVIRKDEKMTTIEDLHRAADMALDEAKKKGRNRIAYYDEEMYNELKSINEKQQEMAYALKHDQFLLYYQPKINVKTGLVESMEALTRWIHPEKGMIYPGDFIDFAEKSGLIILLGYKMFDMACKQIKIWEEFGEPVRMVSINVSLRQLMEPDFVSEVKSIIINNNVNPSQLEIEITESMFMDESADYIEKLDQLRDFGLLISMDDFGSGYSSLNLINLMPLDVLKIDASLIKTCTTSKKSALLLETIISMAHRLQLDVVAEGVDTDEQKEKMHQLECDYIQGYYYAKPLSPNDFIDFSRTLE